MKETNPFKIKNKTLLFLGTLIITIIIVRILTFWKDPNFFIGNLELHHFYYGVVLLILINLSILFGKFHPRIYLIFSAIATGLILDEFLFIMAKVRSTTTYPSTLSSAIVLTLIIIIIIGIILFDFISRLKHKK